MQNSYLCEFYEGHVVVEKKVLKHLWAAHGCGER